MVGKGDYPADWFDIAERVKQAADWRCERCGRKDEWEWGYRLTVHHLDGDKSNCGFQNLVALCQRCHLHVQARYVPGQMCLPLLGERWIERRTLRKGNIPFRRSV